MRLLLGPGNARFGFQLAQQDGSPHARKDVRTTFRPVLLVELVEHQFVGVFGRVGVVSEPAEDELDVRARHLSIGGRIAGLKDGGEAVEVEAATGVEDADDDGFDAIEVVPEIPFGERIVEGGWEEEVVDYGFGLVFVQGFDNYYFCLIDWKWPSRHCSSSVSVLTGDTALHLPMITV